jgi:hypothetical protein
MLLSLRRNVLFLATIAACCGPSSVWAGNLLPNGGFDTPTTGLSPLNNYLTSITGAGASGPASAADWTLYNNGDATTSTELLTTTDPNGSGSMIHLTSVSNTSDLTQSFFNGLEGAFATQAGATASVDVHVLSGPVVLALYGDNGANLLSYIYSGATTDQWLTLTVTAPINSDPNYQPDLFILYSGSQSGTGEFYAENAIVTSLSIPEPSSGALALIGLTATALWVRKARPRLRRRRVAPST